jgi:hypothetical protein
MQRAAHRDRFMLVKPLFPQEENKGMDDVIYVNA